MGDCGGALRNHTWEGVGAGQQEIMSWEAAATEGLGNPPRTLWSWVLRVVLN